MPRWKQKPEGSNWGEFGEDDQIGRMNLLTAERRLAAAREIQDGTAFTLCLPMDYPGGSVLVAGRQPPKRMVRDRTNNLVSYNYPYSEIHELFVDVTCDDAVTIFTQYSTQWDALSHWGRRFDADGDGVDEFVYYNGFRADEHIVGPDRGGPRADRLGIETLACAGVQGRGVLVDLLALCGQSRVLVGYDLLMQALARQKISIEPGDFLCLYTGYADLVLGMNRNPDHDVLDKACAVLDATDKRLLDWIAQSGIVAICADNLGVESIEIIPRGCDHQAMLPLHELCLFKLGIFLGELWYFGEIAPWLRQQDRSYFFLTAPPLRLPGCVGSPLTPIGTV